MADVAFGTVFALGFILGISVGLVIGRRRRLGDDAKGVRGSLQDVGDWTPESPDAVWSQDAGEWEVVHVECPE
jgi:hypothetical protein